MTGALWAALSGVGFGVFQVLNARAVRGLSQVYVATFVQMLMATAVFVVLLLVRGEFSLAGVPPAGIAHFAMAGLLHFFVGWTTLNQSQVRIGGARTAPLIAASPVFGVFIALIVPGELPGVLTLAAIAVTAAGAYLATDPGPAERVRLRDSGFGLTTAAMWALSAIFTVAGLAEFDDPLLGGAIGMAAATLAYGVILGATPKLRGGMERRSMALKIVAGVIVGLATWWRWLGLADAPVGVVLALQLLTVPTVLLAAVVLPAGERVSRRLWLGSALVVGGVGVLIVV